MTKIDKLAGTVARYFNVSLDDDANIADALVMAAEDSGRAAGERNLLSAIAVIIEEPEPEPEPEPQPSNGE